MQGVLSLVVYTGKIIMSRQSYKYNERVELGRSPEGKRIRKWVRGNSKSELEARKRELIIEHNKVRNPSAVSFGDYADKWYSIYKANKSIATQNMYQNVLKKMDPIRYCPLKEVTASDLQSLINANREHTRICEQLSLALKQIYKQAIKDGIIYPLNIAEGLELPKHKKREMRFISDDEMRLIMSCHLSDQDRQYVEVLRNTGCRPSEALALMAQDIDLDNHVIHVQRAFEYDVNSPVVKSTKTGVCRDIPINDRFCRFLRDMNITSGYLFTRGGKPFTRTMYKKMAGRILRTINAAFGGSSAADKLNGITMYSFRHTYATFLYYHGVKPGLISTKKAAQIMGHSEQVFLSRYTHIDDSKEHLQDIVELLP